MKLNFKSKINNYQNKTLTNSFFKLKYSLMNKQNNEIKEENKSEEKKEKSSISFKKSSIKKISKIDSKTINNKTQIFKKISEEKKPIKLIKQNLSKEKNNLRHKDKYIDSNKKRNNISRNSPLNTNTIKYLDTINNISTDINSKVNSKNNINSNSINKKNVKNLYFPIKKNAINFIDRNKLKATKTINLKLFEKFEEELNKINNNNKKGRIQINNNNFLDSEEFSIYNSLKTLPEIKNEKIFKKILKESNNILNNNNSIINKNKFHKIKKALKNIIENEKTHKTKYSLKKLMELNPYHSVPKNVKYCDSIEIKNISEQLSYVSGITHIRAATSKRHFFKNDISFKNKKNNNFNSKMINSVTVTYNNNYSSHKGELVWRILKKLNKKSVSSSFRQACIFQGYSELWRYYSITLEKMLVNYSEYKWFITKNK